MEVFKSIPVVREAERGGDSFKAMSRETRGRKGGGVDAKVRFKLITAVSHYHSSPS